MVPFQTLHPDLPAAVVDIFGMVEIEIAATDEPKSKERLYWIIISVEGVRAYGLCFGKELATLPFF